MFLNITSVGAENIFLANEGNRDNINESNLLVSSSDEENLKSDEYILGPGDLLEIRFVNNEELNIMSRIFNNGTVQLPLIGSVNINEMTFDEARKTIEDKLSVELSFPLIQLNLIQSRPVNVSLLGEVNNPGFYTLSRTNIEDNLGENMKSDFNLTLVNAIQSAGGITLDANINDVTIIRRLPKSKGKYKKASLSLYALIFEGNHYQNPLLFDGDIIKVHKANKNLQEDLLDVANSNLAPSTIKVNIIGEVNKPGVIEVPANTLLLKAVLMANGVNDLRANTRHVQLIRINKNGSASFRKYKLDFSNNFSSANNPRLENGDVVKVGTKAIVKTSDYITQITKPVSGLGNLFLLYRAIGD